MAKDFETTLKESGRQSEIDTLRKSGNFAQAESQFKSTGNYTGLAKTPVPTRTPAAPGKALDLGGGKKYGGWYDNPTSGKNQRYWGADQTGKQIWTDGDDPNFPKSADEVTPFLNDYQNNIFRNASAPETRIPTTQELKAKLSPETGRPELIDRKGLFENYRTEYGIADLETELNALKGQEDEEVAAFRSQRFDERGKPVATNVIQGRISEEEQQAQERLDFIGRQKERIVDELNTKYTIIGQFMDFAGLDYKDATDRYQEEFTQNLQVHELISGEKKEARSEFESDRTAAKANLTMYVNAITSGNVDYGSLSGDQRVMINKLETQAGLPVGFISRVKKDPDADIVFTTTNEGVTQVGIRNADGSISVQSYGTRNTGTASDKKATRQQFDDASQGDSTFPDLVEKFAVSMSLTEIYQAYANTDKGKEFGDPVEDRNVMQVVYEVAKGDISEDKGVEKLRE